MAHLVRARTKDLKEWPEWAKKCGCRRGVPRVEFLVDLSDSSWDQILQCVCGKFIEAPERFKAVRMVSGPSPGRRTPFILLDLDEGVAA